MPKDDTTNGKEKQGICLTCGKVVGDHRKGSFTAWIFRSSSCECTRQGKEHSDTAHGPVNMPDRGGDTVKVDADPHQQEESTGKSPRPADPIVGTEFAGKFDVLELLGHGGMGSVYKVRHKHLNRTQALKVLHKHLWLDHLAVERFRAEAKSVHDLQHTNLVSIRDFGVTDDEQPYIAMDFIEGETLSRRIRKAGALSLVEVVDIFCDIANGIKAVHGHGMIHRDIKPDNVMFDDEGVLKLVDFGIAKSIVDDATVQLTKTGEIFGSPPYMSPEQWNQAKLDSRSDIYSIGCLIYECLTGRPPIVGDNLIDIARRQETEIPEPPSKVKPELLSATKQDIKIADLDYVVMRCLEKNPADRYATIDELMIDLDQLRANTTIKNKVTSSTVVLKRVRNTGVGLVLAVATIFSLGYLVHPQLRNFTDNGMLHASCMAQIWFADIGTHIGDLNTARSIFENALGDASRHEDPYTKRSLNISILERLSNLYERTGQMEKKKAVDARLMTILQSSK